jgi:hypothetical protein
MHRGFKDPLEIKNQKPQDQPKEGKNSPWDFRCPQYDQRSSCFIKAGTNYGIGRNSPIGKMKHTTFDTVPEGRVKTMRIDE